VETPEELSAARGPVPVRGDVLSLPVRNPSFRLLFLAMVVSFAGDWFLFVALAGLLDELTGSPAFMAGMYVAMTVPFALFTLVGGPLADRLDRQRLMVASDVLRGLLVLGFFLVDQPSEVWAAFLLAAAVAALGAVFEPAALAAVPNLVAREDLPAANMLSGAAWGTMLAAGSALGGLVVGAFGREAGYLGDALSFLLSAALVLRIRGSFAEPRPGHGHPGLVEATRETLHYARRDHRVLALLAAKAAFGLGAGSIALLPALALQVFHAGEAGAGVLLAFRGVGIVLGPFLVRLFVRGEDFRALLWAVAGAFALFAAGYAAVPLMPSVPAAGLFVLLAHLGGGVQWTLSSYGLQRLTPDPVRGRVLAFDQGLLMVTVAASAMASGWAAEAVGVRPVMLGVALVAVACTAAWTAATAGVRRSARLGVSP
jgi:predicted MFS family arabinose efflux permease